MRSHEDTGPTLVVGTLSPLSGDFSIIVYFIETEDRQFDLLFLMGILFGRRVILLLSFLGTTSQSEHQMKGRFLLDVVVAQGSAILQLFTGKDESLLIWRNALFVLDLGFDILDGIAGLDLEGYGFTRKGLHEDLHPPVG